MAEPRVALNVHELALVSTGGRQLVEAHTLEKLRANRRACFHIWPLLGVHLMVAAVHRSRGTDREAALHSLVAALLPLMGDQWECCARRAAADGGCAYRQLQLHCAAAALHSLLHHTTCCTVPRRLTAASKSCRSARRQRCTHWRQ